MKNEQKDQSNPGVQKPLPLTVEGKEYSWKDQYITGLQIKQLANIPVETELYLSISKPYQDELIENEQEVNLARPTIEHFFVKKKLNFFINAAPFTWYKQFISGAQIRQLGAIPTDHDLFLDIKEGWEDDAIADDEIVDLARPGREHFKSKAKEKEVTIIVKGKPHKWDKPTITLKDVIVLAYGTYVDNDAMTYTVAYEDGPKSNPEGSMTKQSVVFVKNKMIFHATAADKS